MMGKKARRAVTSLALKVEEGAVSQGMWWPPETDNIQKEKRVLDATTTRG